MEGEDSIGNRVLEASVWRIPFVMGKTPFAFELRGSPVLAVSCHTGKSQ